MSEDRRPRLAGRNAAKIIATLGPATESEDTIAALIQAGASLVRLNFSHGDRDYHRTLFQRVRQVEQALGTFVAVIADLQGPKIRTGALQRRRPVHLKPGAHITITTEDIVGTAERISTTYRALPQDVKPGDRVLMDDGLIELRVLEVQDTEVRCQVVIGGKLGEHKGINLPGVAVSAPALTAKDRADLEYALDLGVDYIALSFVRSAVDIAIARDAIAAQDKDVPVIAKLERPEAIGDLEAIIRDADAVMIARGDLGVELAPEHVPMLQKRIIRECARQRVPVITATQMLESMREQPSPTRAEATDVANAILDGTDAVMLSGETAIGKYPVQAVEMMNRIGRSATEELFRGPHLSMVSRDDQYLSFDDALSRAAAHVAEDLDTAAIIAFTHSGSTARLASKCRPRVPIVAATPSVDTARRCALYWGVTPMLIEPVTDTDQMLSVIERKVREHGLAASGDVVVVTAGTPMGQRGRTNLMKLQVIP